MESKDSISHITPLTIEIIFDLCLLDRSIESIQLCLFCSLHHVVPRMNVVNPDTSHYMLNTSDERPS